MAITELHTWPIHEPEQLELDLKVKPELLDENTRYTVAQVTFYFDREITQNQWNRFVIDLDDAATNKGYPGFMMSAIVETGTDRELYPEEYDESEESD